MGINFTRGVRLQRVCGAGYEKGAGTGPLKVYCLTTVGAALGFIRLKSIKAFCSRS